MASVLSDGRAPLTSPRTRWRLSPRGEPFHLLPSIDNPVNRSILGDCTCAAVGAPRPRRRGPQRRSDRAGGSARREPGRAGRVSDDGSALEVTRASEVFHIGKCWASKWQAGSLGVPGARRAYP